MKNKKITSVDGICCPEEEAFSCEICGFEDKIKMKLDQAIGIN